MVFSSACVLACLLAYMLAIRPGCTRCTALEISDIQRTDRRLMSDYVLSSVFTLNQGFTSFFFLITVVLNSCGMHNYINT